MQRISAFLLFVGDKCGKAEEAVKFYTSLFDNSEIKHIEYFKEEEEGEKEGIVKSVIFTIDGQEYIAGDSSLNHPFTFTPSMSIFVNCKDEKEIDFLVQKLSKGGHVLVPLGDPGYGFSKKFCWVEDKYSVSWQLNLIK